MPPSRIAKSPAAWILWIMKAKLPSPEDRSALWQLVQYSTSKRRPWNTRSSWHSLQDSITATLCVRVTGAPVGTKSCTMFWACSGTLPDPIWPAMRCVSPGSYMTPATAVMSVLKVKV